MLSNVFSALTSVVQGRAAPKTKIMLWGVDVDKLTTLGSLLKTGKYEEKVGSIYSDLIVDVSMGGVLFDIAIPSVNEGARRSFRPMLESFDGIVFVHPNASDQELIASSDEELRSLLEDEAIRGNDVPILIIVEGNGDNQPDYAGAIAKMVRESRGEDEAVKILNVSKGSQMSKEEYTEGFDWLSMRLSST